MRQNHPETSFIAPQSIPKHIPKLFFGGGGFTPSPPKTAPLGYSAPTGLKKLPKPPRDHLVQPQNPSAGVPVGNQVFGCLVQCPKTPYNHYGTLPWGPQGTLGSAKSNLKIFTVFQPNLPCKTAKTSTGPSCADPKPVCGGPCGQPSAWIPPTVSQDTKQSLWDPTLGSPGHPGSGKNQLVKSSPFSSQICLTKLPKPPRDHLVRPQNPSAGVPAGDQVLGCLLQCPKTPYNHYGTLPWGPLGTLVSATSKIF